MGIDPASHGTGHTDRQRPGSRDLIKPGGRKKFRCCEGSRPATGIERRNLSGLSVVEDPECIASDAIHMRTYDGQHACHRNHGVRRIAAALQDP